MIQVTDKEIIGAIHMEHWLRETTGPTLDTMLNSVVMFYPDFDEIVSDGPDGVTHKMFVTYEHLRSRIIENGERNMAMFQPIGTTRWIKYDTSDGAKESLSMYVGNGLWLTEESKHVWFFDIDSLWEVDVEISSSQSGH